MGERIHLNSQHSFNSLVNSTANCGPLSKIILSSNLCNFHMLSLNSLTNPSADVSSIIAIKCVILDNLLYITKITSFLATNSNFVMKSTVKYVHSLFSIFFLSTFLLVPLFYSSFFDTSHIHPHNFLHSSFLLATSNFLSPTLLFFISLYVQLLVHYGITRLFLLLTPHPSVHTPFLFLTSILSLPAIHVSKLSFFFSYFPVQSST